MDTSVGVVTVRPVELEIVPKAALIVAVPCATPVTRPLAMIVATLVFEELSVTLLNVLDAAVVVGSGRRELEHLSFRK
jgi:hypothetical protein